MKSTVFRVMGLSVLFVAGAGAQPAKNARLQCHNRIIAILEKAPTG